MAGVMPRSRSISSLRRFRSLLERNISVTQVLFQSKFSFGSRAVAACRTASRFTPHDLQNLRASFWKPQCGQNIELLLQNMFCCYDDHRVYDRLITDEKQ